MNHALQDASLYVLQDSAAAHSHAIVENNPLTIAHLVTINTLTLIERVKGTRQLAARREYENYSRLCGLIVSRFYPF